MTYAPRSFDDVDDFDVHPYQLGMSGKEERSPESVRLWMSDEQWLALIQRIERQKQDYDGPDRRGHREERYNQHLHCVLRLGVPGESAPGTYMIASRNISAGGMGFLHHRAIEAQTRCAIAMQAEAGDGEILVGQVAWCNQVEDALFDIGVAFDHPIDVSQFVDA